MWKTRSQFCVLHYVYIYIYAFIYKRSGLHLCHTFIMCCYACLTMRFFAHISCLCGGGTTRFCRYKPNPRSCQWTLLSGGGWGPRWEAMGLRVFVFLFVWVLVLCRLCILAKPVRAKPICAMSIWSVTKSSWGIRQRQGGRANLVPLWYQFGTGLVPVW
jgi:hypothetical protein